MWSIVINYHIPVQYSASSQDQDESSTTLRGVLRQNRSGRGFR